jgi:NAD(P)-dependent dehydrogenase (short-subunit alcohol dehydrogenase family)
MLMGRRAQPEEVAPAPLFVASGADASYITGEVLTPTFRSKTLGTLRRKLQLLRDHA